MKTNQGKYILVELLAVAFLATAGIFVRRSTLLPINTGFWRMALSLPFLFIFAYKELKDISTKDKILCILSGLFLTGDAIFYNMALVKTSIANTNLLGNLISFIIVPVSFFLFKEKIPKFYLVGLIITIIGVVLLVTGKAVPSPSNYIGDIFAGCATIFYALYFLSVYKFREKMSSTVIMFLSTLGTTIGLVFACLFLEKGIQVPTTLKEYINLFMFAICMQVIGHSLLAFCQGKISVNLSSAITLLQPVFAAIYSLMLFNEVLTIKEVTGILVVIVGVYICKCQYTAKTEKK